MVAYNARDYASQLSPGEKYDQLKLDILVIVVDFKMFNDTAEFCEHILFRRENNKIFTKAQQFFIIDLTKTPSELTEPLHMWGRLFKIETEEELRMLMEISEEMRNAGEKLLELSTDQEAQAIAEARRLAIWERNDIWNARETRVRGEEQRIADVRVQQERDKADAEKAEIAKKLLSRGLSVEDVAEDIGLSHSVVHKLMQHCTSNYSN